MSDRELLVRHTEAWAASKDRPLDPGLLEQVLGLRRHDDDVDGAWPPGSAERLLLVTWPAYGPPPPDPEALRDTLDTFWGFLRATGRMASGSASPAELRKEARRTLPRMAAAYDDPAQHSSGRVIADFGRSIGIDIEGAADTEDLQGRLASVTAAWNALPQEERVRLMPDPSPKSRRGEAFTAAINGGDVPGPVPRGDVRVSARGVREAPFVRSCLALADWVGSGREVTKAGLLRPAVAREAYRHLDLWPWEREQQALWRHQLGHPHRMSEEADRVAAETSLRSWTSAGDCLPLDRLWYACDAAGLVDIRSTRAIRSDKQPDTDDEWRDLGLVLVAGLCLRLGSWDTEPLGTLLLVPLDAEGPVPTSELRDWWEAQCPPPLRDLEALGWRGRLDTTMFHFADCGLWQVDRQERLALTDFGRDFALTYSNLLDAGFLED